MSSVPSFSVFGFHPSPCHLCTFNESHSCASEAYGLLSVLVMLAVHANMGSRTHHHAEAAQHWESLS